MKFRGRIAMRRLPIIALCLTYISNESGSAETNLAINVDGAMLCPVPTCRRNEGSAAIAQIMVGLS
jgi:hypothetical protein